MGKCGGLACFLSEIGINLLYMKTMYAKGFEEKIFSFIRKHQMLPPGERAVAGISGGADSVCLLLVLLEWKRQYGLELAVVHVNHGIRPEAGEDARFVQELCEAHGIPFYLRETDVRRLALEQKCSEEEAGRSFRYQAFYETAKELGAGRIAVAHNLNDQGETMLFHLFRGTGLKGLAGILPVRDGIIRPLLCVERREIEQYLEEKGQNYCRDATNEEDIYARNRIRHHILSYAEQELAPGCVRHMGRTAELLAETEDYLERQTFAALEQCVEGGFAQEDAGNSRVSESVLSSYVLDRNAFLKFHPAVGRRMLHLLLRRLSPGAKDISRTHVEALYSLFAEEGNRLICLPFGIRGRREYGRVILERGQQAGKGLPPEGFRADFQVFSIEELPRNDENSLIFPQNEYTKWFDCDKIKKSPVFRNRMQGDYLTIRDGQGRLHHKKLKDYMVTEKIPCVLRESVPVLAEDSHVLWLAGYRISEYYKVSENTKRVLQVQLMMDCNGRYTEEEDGGAYQGTFIGGGSGCTDSGAGRPD